jgi:hypothetical protein
MRIESRELLAVGIFGSGSQIGDRIELLLRRGRTFSPRASVIGVTASAAMLGALVLAGSLTPHWIAFAQQPDRPSFDVTSVKPVSRDKLTGPGRLRYNPQGVDFSNVPLGWVIGEAYGIAYNRISSSDQRIKDTFFAPEGTAYFFNIAAKADHPVPKAQIRLMLQTLLADRFCAGSASGIQNAAGLQINGWEIRAQTFGGSGRGRARLFVRSGRLCLR